jgi:hypothetical protein
MEDATQRRRLRNEVKQSRKVILVHAASGFAFLGNYGRNDAVKRSVVNVSLSNGERSCIGSRDGNVHPHSATEGQDGGLL